MQRSQAFISITCPLASVSAAPARCVGRATARSTNAAITTLGTSLVLQNRFSPNRSRLDIAESDGSKVKLLLGSDTHRTISAQAGLRTATMTPLPRSEREYQVGRMSTVLRGINYHRLFCVSFYAVEQLHVIAHSYFSLHPPEGRPVLTLKSSFSCSSDRCCRRLF